MPVCFQLMLLLCHCHVSLPRSYAAVLLTWPVIYYCAVSWPCYYAIIQQGRSFDIPLLACIALLLPKFTVSLPCCIHYAVSLPVSTVCHYSLGLLFCYSAMQLALSFALHYNVCLSCGYCATTLLACPVAMPPYCYCKLALLLGQYAVSLSSSSPLCYSCSVARPQFG
jgi:hypothetical protein